MMEESEPDDYSSDDLQLKIAETPKKKRKRKGKHQIPVEMQKLDKTIFDTMQKCKNLTSESAKKMLCKLVKNDHILALTLLKAEEETEKEQNSSENEDEEKKSESDVDTPKLTRSKAKQLNKILPIPGSLKTPLADEEVIRLIQEDLKSDSEDEDWIMSDGDITNNTISDIDSQPSTPGSSLFVNDESPIKNGEFKIPKTPLTAEEQENIARRTRSKLCLQTTSIETIESTFIPPDIDLEMYDFDMYENEDDCEWKEFLNEFMMPLPNNTENIDEIDDDADPEYVAELVIPDDKEEKKLGRVSKKELNQLISELIEDSCNATFENIDELITSNKKNNEPQSTSKNSKRQTKFTPSKKIQQPKINQKCSQTNELNTPPHAWKVEESKKNDTIENTPEQISKRKNEYYYSPPNLQVKTPQKTGYITPITHQSPNASNIPYSYAPPHIPLQSSPLAMIQPQTTIDYSPIKNLPSILVVNQNHLEIRPLSDPNGSFNSNSIINQGYFYNGMYTLPQYQSVVVQVPTIDILQNGLNFSSMFNNSFDKSREESKENAEDNITEELKTKLKRESRLKIFDYLNNEDAPITMKTESKHNGFTIEQYLIFEQQFRMHSQLLCQHYVQLFAHPKWWKPAQQLKENLLELEAICPKNNLNHIKDCLKLCKDWEAELEENNEKNKKYIEFIYNEIELDERAYQEKKHFKGLFHNRLMEIVMQSNAIIYPNLLPKTPFRAVKFTKVDPLPSELSMIALGIEHAYEKIYRELNSLNPRKLREPKIMSIVSTIIRIFGSFRSENGLLKLIEKYRQHSLMNPIKYYFQHKRAPAVTHKIIDLENIHPPIFLRRGLLPKVWDDYKFSEERLQVFPFGHGKTNKIDVKSIDVKKIGNTNLEKQEKIIGEVVAENILSQQKVLLHDSIQLEIVCIDSSPKINITILPKEDKNLVHDTKKVYGVDNIQKRSPSLKNWLKTNEEKQNNLTSILKKVTKNVEKSPSKKKSVNFLLPTEQPDQNKSSNFTNKIKASFSAKKKFQVIIESFFSTFSKYLNTKDDVNPLIRKIFIRTRSFDIYWQIVSCNIMLSKKNKQDGLSSNSSEFISKTKKQISSEEYSKKINRKLTDNRALIMNSKNSDAVEKDCSYAFNYLQRVRKTLLENGDDELYSQFMKMLTAFNPEIESVPELYYKMEKIFMPNYSDLLDLFLTFLLPEHATEIGKFCEHFMLTNMTNLCEKLNVFFQKQPHLKKIYACINELSNEHDLTLERLKTKILPLLKGNQVLIDWFMELFERPSENSTSLDEYETLHLKKSLNDSETVDDAEEMQSQDLIEVETSNLSSCGVKYINGKIMYRCKTLLPAKISFLANDMICDEKNSSQDDNSSPLCVHEIRKHIQFIDTKKSNDNQDEKTKKKKVGRKKFKICDSQTLHAHAIRLNHPIHAQNGEKLTDVLNLLESNYRNVSNESPKKPMCKNTKKTGNSPKKVLKSPSSSSSDISMNFSSPSPSKTLQINRKFKSLVNDSEDEQQQTKKQKTMDSSYDSEKNNSHNEIDIIVENASSTPSISNEPENVVVAWTREEDKQMLEEIRNDFSDKDKLIKSLSLKLENRTEYEIRERFEFLLNFLANLTSS